MQQQAQSKDGTSAERPSFATNVATGLFGALYVQTKTFPVDRWPAIAGLIINAFQLLADEEGYVEIEDIADVAAKWYRHQLRKRRDTFKARKHLDSGRFLQSSVFNLLAPVLLVGVWAGAIVAYILVLARSTERSSLQMSLTEELQSEVEALGIDVLDIMTTQSQRDQILADIRSVDAELTNDFGALVYGGELNKVSGGTYSLNRLTRRQESTAYDLLYLDGCMGVPRSELASSTTRDGQIDPDANAEPTVYGQCRVIESNVMSEGAFFGAMAWLQLLQEAVSGVPPDSVGLDQPLLRVSTSRVFTNIRRLLDLERPHLRQALAATTQAFRAKKSAILEQWILVVTVVAAAFGALFLLVAIFWYEPSVKNLANPIRAARTLLRLLPLEIVDALPPLRIHLKAAMLELQMLKQDTFGGQTADAARRLRRGQDTSSSGRRLSGGGSRRDTDRDEPDTGASYCCGCLWCFRASNSTVRGETYLSRDESLRDMDSSEGGSGSKVHPREIPKGGAGQLG